MWNFIHIHLYDTHQEILENNCLVLKIWNCLHSLLQFSGLSEAFTSKLRWHFNDLLVHIQNYLWDDYLALKNQAQADVPMLGQYDSSDRCYGFVIYFNFFLIHIFFFLFALYVKLHLHVDNTNEKKCRLCFFFFCNAAGKCKK